MQLKLYISILIILVTSGIYSQNRITYSQYMHNLGVFNPAYFSLGEEFTATAYYRRQWLGIDGSPTTKSLVAGLSVKNKHRVNLNIYQDGITIFNDFKVGLGYNYRIKMTERSYLSLGFKADYGQFQSNYTDLTVQDIGDNVVLNNPSSKRYLNIGTGMYYQSPSFFASLSSPFLLNNSVLKPLNHLGSFALKFNHIYAAAGGKFHTESVAFFPTMLLKVVGGAPPQIDLNANVLLYQQIWLSGGLRNDLTIILSTGYVMRNGMKLIYSYDISSFSNAYYSAGTHEISLGYGFSFYRLGLTRKKYVKKSGKFKRKFKVRPSF